MTHEETVRVWFDAWLTRESAVIPEIFAQDVRYVECYGPEYIGRGEVVYRMRNPTTYRLSVGGTFFPVKT